MVVANTVLSYINKSVDFCLASSFLGSEVSGHSTSLRAYSKFSVLTNPVICTEILASISFGEV